ncbi:uncharacterized protein LOC114161953 isoform X1 [Xiphophorus couchianus]|uniref:uncharacterized protein LOC114161953 isoform X1 n=1 Tax=Xiphophorus couchianus TaxID=32473 RepID=UPI001016F6C5|nr:uncharacterized protein LOC114161953 isoform X1 [Xiphophorus couchianus]
MRCKVLVFAVLLALVKPVFADEIEANPNTNATLPCRLSPPGDKMDVSLIRVDWTRESSTVASFDGAEEEIKEGFSWDPSDFTNGDFSISILSASFSLQGIYKCTVSYNSTELLSGNVTFSILAPPSVSVPQKWGVLEKESQLECHARGFYPPPVFFSWTREEEVIQPALQVEGEPSPDGFYTAVNNLTFYPSKDDQNVTFSCQVSHRGSTNGLDFRLSVTHLPSVRLSVVQTRSTDVPLTLFCDVESFYPEDVSVSWFQNGTALPDPPTTDQNPNRTYTTRRYFTLSPEQRRRRGTVECAVNQPGVVDPTRTSADLDKLDSQDEAPVLTKSAKASVAMMCISIVLVFLLCFGFSWRRRDEKQKSLTVSAIILPPHVFVGQKGRVSVSIEGRRVDRVQTRWFLNDTAINDTSLTGTSRSNFNCLSIPLTTIHLPFGLTLTSPASEKGSLLTPRGDIGYYKLHTQGPVRSSGKWTQQLVSALTFIPRISLHKGAVFKCQVSYVGKDKIVEERVSERFTILSAPEVSEIQLAEAENNPDVINMTVGATHFHPDVITFRWFCQGGELSPVASKASSSPWPNSEGFFSAFSQCKLPRREVEKGATKVWVSVHHVALKQPITRETRGFIKRPCVSDVVSFTHASDQSFTLGCEITDFYPPNISVTWLKLGDGEEDDREEEVIEGGELWGPIQTEPRLFRATATLKRKPILQEKRDRGGGVTCRVQHCSLKEPIERHWRNTDNASPTIPPSISVCWSSEGVGVFSILLKGGHPKAQLLWSAGGPTFSPLVSSETEEIGDGGQRELRSVCALEKSANLPRTPDKPERRKNGHAIKTKAAVTDPDTEGIEYIDEKVDREKDRYEGTMSASEEDEEDSDKEMEGAAGALHINKVNLRTGLKDGERERLRVCVEITHPALKIPVYRTWTEPNEEISSSA